MKLGFFTMPIHPIGKDWRQTLREDREAFILQGLSPILADGVDGHGEKTKFHGSAPLAGATEALE